MRASVSFSSIAHGSSEIYCYPSLLPRFIWPGSEIFKMMAPRRSRGTSRSDIHVLDVRIEAHDFASLVLRFRKL